MGVVLISNYNKYNRVWKYKKVTGNKKLCKKELECFERPTGDIMILTLEFLQLLIAS
jgi:hypothetical protein